MAAIGMLYTPTMPMESIKNYFYKSFAMNKVAASKAVTSQAQTQQEKPQSTPTIEAKPAQAASWRTLLYSYFYGKPASKETAPTAVAEKSQFSDLVQEPAVSPVAVKETPAQVFSYKTFDNEGDVKFSQKSSSEAFETIRLNSDKALAEAYQSSWLRNDCTTQRGTRKL